MSTFNSKQFNTVPFNGSAASAAVLVTGILAVDMRSIAANIMDVRTIAVAKLGVSITRLVAGDTWKLIRTYTGLQTGTTITKVYWTVKNDPTDADGSALFQKSITSSLAAAGQITDASSSDASIAFNIIASAANTASLTVDQEYYYDLQGIGSDGAVYTFETGLIIPAQGVTTASS